MCKEILILHQKIRRQIASLGQQMEMMGCLHLDIFTQHQYILNGVDVKVKPAHPKDVFNLIVPETTIAYKSVITYAALIVRQVKASYWLTKRPYCKQIPSTHKENIYLQMDVITHARQFVSKSDTFP